MSASTDPNVLAGDANCLICIPPGMQMPVMIWLLCQIAGVTTDPNTLIKNAGCLQCIDPGMQGPVMIWLLTQIAGGGTGGSVNNLVAYTVAPPVNPPNPNALSIAYDPTGNLPDLNWNIGTQTWN